MNRTQPDSTGLRTGLTNRTPDSLYRVRSGKSDTKSGYRTEKPVRFVINILGAERPYPSQRLSPPVRVSSTRIGPAFGRIGDFMDPTNQEPPPALYFHCNESGPESMPPLYVTRSQPGRRLAWPVTIVVRGDVSRAQLVRELLFLAATIEDAARDDIEGINL